VRDLPERVLKLIEAGVVAEFATASFAGVAIDTPTYYFPSDDLRTIDLATGLPNPAKAERARRNPKVGLLIDGNAHEPVVAIRAHAAVRDADLQANAIRYLAETGFKSVSHGLSWERARTAVHYWSRIIIENTPARVMWWENPASMDETPQFWNAPANAVYPLSDPKPIGDMTRSAWPARPWLEVAREAAAGRWPANLAVLDDDGYPMPMRARAFELVEGGFRLEMPRGVPWRYAGAGSVTFGGFQTFVGESIPHNAEIFFKVERALPQLPSTKDTTEVLQPTEDTRRKAMARLEYEAKRRGQSIPTVPAEVPPPTRLARLRQARIASHAPITGMALEKGHRTT
jgi:hypothetical protein